MPGLNKVPGYSNSRQDKPRAGVVVRVERSARPGISTAKSAAENEKRNRIGNADGGVMRKKRV